MIFKFLEFNGKTAFFLGLLFSSIVASAEDVSDLDPNHGYLLVAIDSNANLEKIRIGGEKNFNLQGAVLAQGVNYQLIPVRAGKYYFSRLLLSSDFQFPLEKKKFGFNIEEGKINYVGHLKYRRVFFSDRAKIELLNRSSVAMEYLEQSNPHLIEQIPVVHSGYGDDAFFTERYKKQQTVEVAR